ncbi:MULTISPECIES: hypothetical protein [unclassified Knoellia]|uniref:hypothetical protein n=1 Tax=Knoellia altitudinis TaxID=3404795 RepID=UPI00360F52CC
MNTVLRRCVPVLAASSLCVSLTACGGDSDTATEVKPSTSASASASAKPTKAKAPAAGALYKQVRDAALSAKSAHVKGSFTEDGEKTSIDLSGTTDGKNQEASVTIGADGTATVRTVAGKYWVKGDSTFWTKSTGDAAAADAIGAKWIELPPEEAKGMADTTVSTLLKELFEDSDLGKLEAVLTSVKESTLDGAKVYVVTDKVADNGSLVTSADGKNRLLKLTGPKDEPGELTFTEWDAVAPFAAPPAAEIFKR